MSQVYSHIASYKGKESQPEKTKENIKRRHSLPSGLGMQVSLDELLNGNPKKRIKQSQKQTKEQQTLESQAKYYQMIDKENLEILSSPSKRLPSTSHSSVQERSSSPRKEHLKNSAEKSYSPRKEHMKENSLEKSSSNKKEHMKKNVLKI